MSEKRLSTNSLFHRLNLQRGLAFGLIIILALLAFEVFNYSTTDYALNDLLGNLSFAGMRWATILAIAFCGIDFAGIARLFTPERGADEPAEVWYLFGAWLLGATMNAMLTWWAVSLAVLNHQPANVSVIDRATLLRVVPVFVSIMVWLSRVLLIGTFSLAGERLFSQSDVQAAPILSRVRRLDSQPALASPSHRPVAAPAFRQSPKPPRVEPSYEPVAMARAPRGQGVGEQGSQGERRF